MTTPIVERHYILPGYTKNLSGVAQEIDPDTYAHVARSVEVIGRAYERSFGKVEDPTRYYTFNGNNVFLNNGLIQVGTARTSDNMQGFPMIRMFTNSVDDLELLEMECGLQQPTVKVM